MATAARSPAISSATAHVRTQRPTPAPSRISQRSPPDSSAGALCWWPAAPSPLAGCTPRERSSTAPSEGLDFDPIAPEPEKADAITAPYGYRWTPILRWGDPLFADSPDFAPGSPNAAAQALQFGYNNDFLAIMDIDGSGRSALLCCNHEFTNRAIMFPPSESEIQEQEALKATMAAQGLSVAHTPFPLTVPPRGVIS